MKSILVIGSINMDLVCRAPRLPRAGETLIGTDFLTIPGGKGANQAVAAARLGGMVSMVGAVGDDDFGRDLIDGLVSNGVDASHVSATGKAASGCAMILVDERGENSIVVVPGANAQLTPQDIDRATPAIASASAVVMQLEVPVETVRHAAALCRRLGVHTILDPAPVPPGGLPADLFQVDMLTPNEHEAALLTGEGDLSPEALIRRLRANGAKAVALKLGGRGALLADADGERVIEPFAVNVVDTTAAGDAFTAALAVAHAQGTPMPEAMRFANAAGALCCQGFGAQPSLPTRAAVDAFLETSKR